MTIHRTLLAISLVTAWCAIAPSVSPNAHRADASPASTHPYFDDAGTLTWFTRLEDAQAAARASGKLIFVEYGRRACCNCRTLVACVLPCPTVAPRMAKAAIGLAADCDEPDPRIAALFDKNLADAKLLPFVAFATPDLAWVTGWCGRMDAQKIGDHIGMAEARLAKAGPPAAVAPVAGREPAAVSRPVVVETAAWSKTVAPARGEAPAESCLARAREAARGEGWGQVLRLASETRLAVTPETSAEWKHLCDRADGWAEGCLCRAVTAARERKFDEAKQLLGRVRTEMAGRASASDAERGNAALARFESLAGASASGDALATAYTEFAGTRWADLFRRSSGG